MRLRPATSGYFLFKPPFKAHSHFTPNAWKGS
jgi:hypothetical protein